MLTGDGADELFGGYDWYVAAYKLWRRRRLRAQIVNNNPAARALKRLHRWFEPIDLDVLARRPFAATSQVRQRAEAARETVALLTRRELRQAALFRHLEMLPRHEDRAFLALCFEDVYVHMAESLRSKDRMAMACSVEDRVPFLDNALIDFGLHLPLAAKYRDGRTKPLVHDLASKRLPAEVVDLPKIGFWVRDAMWRGMAPFLAGGFVAELLRWSSAEERDLLELLARHPRFLYRVICLELWGRLFFRGQSCEQLTEALLAQRSRAV
jgi:asparagine synthase (glutamine-hydrolysing)